MPQRHTPTPVLSAVFAALLGAAACHAPGREAAVRVDGGTLELQRIVDEVQRQSGVPALAAAWARGDGAVHAVIAGTRTAGNRDDPAHIDDRVRLGLASNHFVAMAALRAMTHTPLRWESTVGEVLRDMASDIRPEYRQVTVAQLLAHETTLPPFLVSNAHELAIRAGASADPRAQREALVRWALARAPEAPPRAKGYPDVDYLVLAHMAEHGTDAFEVLVARIASLARDCGSEDGSDTGGIVLPGHIGTAADIRAAPAQDPDTLPAGLTPIADVRCSIAGLGRFARDQVAMLRGGDQQFAGLTVRGADIQRLFVRPSSPVSPPRIFQTASGATSSATLVTLIPDESLAVVVAANAGFGDRACEQATAVILESLRAGAP